MKKLTAISAAILATALVSGCGAGLDPVTTASSTAEAARVAMDGVVLKEGIGKEAYSLTNGFGKYGVELQAAGWAFKSISDLSQIPNTPKVIVYINASDPAVNSKALADFMVSFEGVVVIDSNWIKPASAPAGDEKEALIKTAEQGSKDMPATQLHSEIMPGGISPHATTLIHLPKDNSVIMATFDQEGLINGSKPQEYIDRISLQVSAASNVLGSKDGAERYTERSDLGSALVSHSIQNSTEQAGWILAGSARFWAVKQGDGQNMLYSEVQSGDSKSTCLINRSVRCGVYPKYDNTILTITTNVADRTRMNVYGHARKHYASVGVSNTSPTGTIVYGPSAASWGEDALTARNATEEKWSKGFSVGGATSKSSVGSYLLGFNSAYTYSKQFTKRTERWSGYSTNSQFFGYSFYYSGIRLNDTWDHVDGETRLYPDHNNPNTLGNLIDTHASYSIGHSGLLSYCRKDGNNKPTHAFVGWNPGVVASTPIALPANKATPVYVIPALHVERSSQDYQQVGKPFLGNHTYLPLSTSFKSVDGCQRVVPGTVSFTMSMPTSIKQTWFIKR